MTDNTDCNDFDAAINPGAAEVCNGVDDNCEGSIDEGLPLYTYYYDSDLDGYGNPWWPYTTCDPVPPYGYVTNSDDCNDWDYLINPSATEVCDYSDNDCNGSIDDGLPLFTYFPDWDGDGYGNPWWPYTTCDPVPPYGYVTNSDDCYDWDYFINPSATEVCNGLDDNCDGNVDEGFSPSTYYFDWDGDGYGNFWYYYTTCDPMPPGYVDNADDCFDWDAYINPSATEVCNGWDDNCDGNVDEGFPPGGWYYADIDGDGYGNWDFGTGYFCGTPPPGWADDALGLDCDEFDPSINPGASEIFCNGMDENCSGPGDDDDLVQYEDADGDGYGNPAASYLGCPFMSGYVLNSSDCDDTNPSGSIASLMYLDKDNDGYGETATVISCPGGLCAGNYTLVINFPSYADESVWTVYNGFGTPVLNGGPYSYGNTISTSLSGAQGPYTFEISTIGYWCDNYGTVSITAEGGYTAFMGFGPCSVDDLTFCTGYGLASTNDDCDDEDAGVYPGATEICNSLDDNCDGIIDNAFGMALTQLNLASCGVTVLTYTHVLRANHMAGALQYEFEFTDGVNTYYELRPNRGFYFSLFTWPLYSTTYTVRVRWFNGTNWSCWGPPCTVTTPVHPVTFLDAASCGATASSPSHVFRAVNIPGALQYEFEFDDGVNTFYELRPNRGFNFGLFSWDMFGTTYAVRVRWFDGSTWSPWGPACNVTTSSMPTTQLQPSDCGAVVSSNTQVLRANNMVGAAQYEFKVSDGTNTWYLLRPNRGFYFRLFGLPPGSFAPGAYTVEVRWKDGGTGTWSAWGPVCNITLSAPLSDADAALNENTLDVQAFPVPFNDVVQLTVETFSEDPVHITVLDLNGRIIENRQVQMEHNGLITLGEAWAQGVYILRVQQGAESRTLRVVKAMH
ncbi:MAG: MopE-related protein [Flavobacteriales bacterium]|nr:MopE-related protein [Flavobacteriales bacterium]